MRGEGIYRTALLLPVDAIEITYYHFVLGHTVYQLREPILRGVK